MADTQRRPILAGNWKMNRGTTREATELTREIIALLGPTDLDADVVVCPPFAALHAVKEVLSRSEVGDKIALGAQSVFWKVSGAYTGQVSAPMLVDAGVSYVLIGHSEARGRFGVVEPDFSPDVLKHFGETDVTVNRKTKAALEAGLTPIICVGETLIERQNGHTDGVVQAQVTGALDGISPQQASGLVFAYEPVWAIGTGEVCAPNEAGRVCGVVRQAVQRVYSVYNNPAAGSVRVQYGGSMKPDNAADLLAQADIDGGLIGGASLKASDFVAIVRAASTA